MTDLILFGKKQEKVDFFVNADLFVLPSHNENFGLVYVEALAAGTPVVASKNTPWEEVEDANCGKWVNNCVVETAKAMIEMHNGQIWCESKEGTGSLFCFMVPANQEKAQKAASVFRNS